MKDQCEAAEYRFITERIRQWEEVYEQDEFHRVRDVRDDLLALYRRGVEIQLTTIFALQSKVYGTAQPPVPEDQWIEPYEKMVGLFERGERAAQRTLAAMERIEQRVIRLEERLFGWIDRLIGKVGELVSVLCGRGRREQK